MILSATNGIETDSSYKGSYKYIFISSLKPLATSS